MQMFILENLPWNCSNNSCLKFARNAQIFSFVNPNIIDSQYDFPSTPIGMATFCSIIWHTRSNIGKKGHRGLAEFSYFCWIQLGQLKDRYYWDWSKQNRGEKIESVWTDCRTCGENKNFLSEYWMNLRRNNMVDDDIAPPHHYFESERYCIIVP